MACKSSRSVTSVEVLGFVSWTASAAAFGECCAMCCEHAVENEPIGWSQVSHHMATVRSSVFAMGVRASSDAGELWCDVLPQQVLGHGTSAMVLSGADLLLCGLREVSRPCGTTTLPECHGTDHFACGRASCPICAMLALVSRRVALAVPAVAVTGRSCLAVQISCWWSLSGAEARLQVHSRMCIYI